jgi:hypothetical protein
MTFHIPERQVQAAFEILRSTEHAIARAAFEASERGLKVVLAKAARDSSAKTVAERENAALCSEAYRLALESHHSVSEHYFILRDKRDAATACMDAWRTQQSDLRSGASRAA